MRSSTFSIVAFTLLFSAMPTMPAKACTYVRGYGPLPQVSSCPLSTGDHIRIVSELEDPAGHTCENETFNKVYIAERTDGCNGSTICTLKLEGNNLSGTYHVSVTGSCLSLCRCP